MPMIRSRWLKRFNPRKRTPILQYKKLTKHAHAPTKGSSGAAGYDLRAAYAYNIPVGERLLILTDLAFKIPRPYYGRIAPRSSIAYIHSIDVAAGVVDMDYRGNVGVVLINNGKDVFKSEYIV